MSSNNPFGGFDFEQLRKMLEQLGFGDAENLNLEDLVAQVSKMQGGAMFGMTNADRDPDAAWRTTLTAAKQLAAESGADPALTPEERTMVVDAERLAQSWLSAATGLPETGRPARAVTRSGWLDETGEGWRRTIEPIIDGLADLADARRISATVHRVADDLEHLALSRCQGVAGVAIGQLVELAVG